MEYDTVEVDSATVLTLVPTVEPEFREYTFEESTELCDFFLELNSNQHAEKVVSVEVERNE